MPRAWLHRRSLPANMTTELTIMRSDNPTNEHPRFTVGTNSSTFVHRRRRLVTQRGRVKVTDSNVPSKNRRYYSDLFTTTLDLPFHWIIFIYSLVYLASWSGFGTLWWLIDYARKAYGYEEFYCVYEVNSWTTAFLFSIETQTTIGYGGRQVTSNCPEGVILLLIQTLVGSFIAATLLGIVFSKASRPKKRSRTVLFSEKAVIGKRNDLMCLMFRVADVQKSQLLECHIQMEMFYTKETKDEEIPYFHQRLSLGNGFGEGQETYYTFLILPNVIAHVIDEQSPLYGMSRLDILKTNVEIVVILEGVIESTGLTMQARTSYTANEIVWGYNFATMPRESTPAHKGRLVVDFADFNELKPVKDMPMCSARDAQRPNDVNLTTPDDSTLSERTNEVRRLQNNSGSQSIPENATEGAVEEIEDGCEVIQNGLVRNNGLQEGGEEEETQRS